MPKDLQFYKFSAYGFLKNLRFFDPFLILFFLEMGINYVEIGTLIAIREITTNILELPTGMIADSFGRRKSMVFSFLSYIASFLAFTFLPGFYFYILAMVLFSCGEAFRTGTHKAMILAYLEMKDIKHLKVHYYGHTRGASQLGSALSSLLAMGLVFFQGSYRWIFLAAVVPYIMELFLMLSYPRELDGDTVHINRGISKKAGVRLTAVTKDFLSLLKRRPVLTRLLSSAVFSGLFKGIKDYLQPLIKKYALTVPLLLSMSGNRRSAILIGTIYFVLFLLTALASKKAGPFADKFKYLAVGINKTYIIGTVFVLLSGLALMLQLFEISILFFVMLYVIQGLRKPMSVACISEQIDSKVMATGLSGESQLRTLFSAFFSFLMGVLVQYAGLDIAIGVIAVLTLLLYPAVRIDPEILPGKRETP
ncbi:MAG: MFS transporter [bacterium]|nr:MFS transporter [bacterium]